MMLFLPQRNWSSECSHGCCCCGVVMVVDVVVVVVADPVVDVIVAVSVALVK